LIGQAVLEALEQDVGISGGAGVGHDAVGLGVGEKALDDVGAIGIAKDQRILVGHGRGHAVAPPGVAHDIDTQDVVELGNVTQILRQEIFVGRLAEEEGFLLLEMQAVSTRVAGAAQDLLGHRAGDGGDVDGQAIGGFAVQYCGETLFSCHGAPPGDIVGDSSFDGTGAVSKRMNLYSVSPVTCVVVR